MWGRERGTVRGLFGLMVAVGGGLGPVAAADDVEAGADAAAASADRQPIETLVVYGERVERPLLEVLSGVTVFDEATLARETGRHVNQLLNLAPNVLIESISETPVVRGVQGGGAGGIATGATNGSLPRLTTVIDGVPQIAALPNSSFSDLYDVKRIEVLRGPQTTLFGRNALGGAVVVETNDPTFEPEAELHSTLAFDGTSRVDVLGAGVVSGPLWADNLAGRVMVQYRDGEDPRDVIGAPAGAETGFLTEFDALRVRAKLLGRANTWLGRLRVEGLVDYETGTTPQTRNDVAGPAAGGAPFDDRVIRFDGPNRTFDVAAITGAVEAELVVSDAFAIESLTSVTRTTFETVPEQVFPSAFDSAERFLAQDLIARFGRAADRLTGLVGLAFEGRDQEIAVVGVPINSDAAVESRQWSAFTDLRLRLRGGLDLVGGGRLLSIAQDRVQTIRTLLPTPGGPVAIPGDTAFDETETVFLPSVGLIWTFADAHSLRASYRAGFNAAGASVNAFTGVPFRFDSERLRAVEAGYRGQVWGERLTLSATAFHYSYDDQQFFLQTVPGDLTSTITTNVPDSSSYGLELDASVKPVDSVTLSLGLGLLETKIGRGPASNPAFDGNDFGRDPGANVTASLLWAPTQWLDLDGQLRYVSGYFPDFQNIPGSQVGDYVLGDLGATVRWRRFELRGFVRNVANETAFLRRVGGFAALAQPRTIGLSITAQVF
ncbi:outer membrane receptor protein involved in Fe transport [Rhodothalassium salexigens DSM 2132]|uniref:Outer membrane receptor protein involved in Fe transport n=2 Tax=Rhodothalassium salexigens TaxID=1086 RepID=A0A4R2PC26_RHOSA|nr:hypothetical protein [Rhodothalassium salexigens DSM 2132]TCP31958.1 outer membrane receptor protein involved in Fe transport [Rhodothalassium salexigens DSM 2132]